MIPQKIMDALNEIEEAVGAEIGVARGETTLQLLSHQNIKKVYAIDPFENYDIAPDGIEAAAGYNDRKIARMHKNKETFDDFYEECIEKFTPYGDRVQIIKDYSNLAVKKIKEKLDFVYIDGNHAFEYVLDDLERYFEIVKPGGLIIGDDFNFDGGQIEFGHGGRLACEVDKACINFCAKLNIKFSVIEGNFVFQKPFKILNNEQNYKSFSFFEIKRRARVFKRNLQDILDKKFKNQENLYF